MQSMSSFSLCVQGRKLLQDSEESHSSTPMTEVSPDFANARFGRSLVLVIAALFLSILCVLGFIAPFRRRRLYRRWGLVSQPSPNMDVKRAQTCMEQKDLEYLPVTIYRTGYPLRAVDCPICLAEFMEGEKVRVLPDCCHSFHAHCIDAWLLSNASCPSCRHSLLYALSKKPSAVSDAEESARMDVTERNESVAAIDVQSFQVSAEDSTMAASSSLRSVTEESARMDVTERNESVAAIDVQSFQVSAEDSTMAASSSLGSVKFASDLESGNAVETRTA